MVGLIDYGMGNLHSVFNALELIGSDVEICSSPESLKDKDRFILPGVGAFRDCINNLEERGFSQALDELVLEEKRPILGICMGMQVMANRGFEGGEYAGLGWIEGNVVPIRRMNTRLKIPHVGWNSLDRHADDTLLKGLPENADVYFVHSYYMNCKNKLDVIATCEYGEPLTAAVHRENIFGTQFHPEKSQDYGLRILENFVRWNN